MFRKKNSAPIVLIVLLLVFIGFCCISMLCGGVMAIANVTFKGFGFEEPFPLSTPTVQVMEVTREILVTATVVPESLDEGLESEPTVESIPVAFEGGNFFTLDALENAVIPMADVEELATRLMGLEDVPDVVSEAPQAYEIGDTDVFWLTDLDTTTSFQKTARLGYITEHAYFWIEDGVSYNEMHLASLAETFEEKIYPTNRAFFGSEWRPGIDNDEHLYIIYARGLGFSVAGYFSSIDSVHPLAAEQSNAHETFMLNADAIGLNERFTYGVLAHEFQHMIHWYQDMNETSWLNEGFSELAALLNDYYDSGFDSLYLWDTDLQLNDWPNNPSETTPHYGAGFLFVTYFMDRFGEQATQALVAHPQNGLASVDSVLDENFVIDITSGEPVSADEFFRDWSLANYLLDSSVFDGRYNYDSLDDIYQATTTGWVDDCQNTTIDSDVKQYGVDYYEITCDQNTTLNFSGEHLVELLPIYPYSGEYALWSNKGDHSDMRLTRQFDLGGLQPGEAVSANFWLWFDIETDYDYLYLLVSEDEEHWEYIEAPAGTDSNPVGSNYGWGYNGVRDTWFEETIDLSDYAGKKIWLRFEYVTDAAVNGEGLLLDDFSLDAVDYFSDFELDDGGWDLEGFVRIDNLLPQHYLVTVIEKLQNGQVAVVPLELEANQTFSYPLTFEDNLESAIIVISGATRYTRTSADYKITFE